MGFQNKPRFILAGIIVLGIFLLGFWFLRNSAQNAYVETSRAVRTEVGKGRYDANATVDSIESLINESPNKIAEAQAISLLAGILFNRNLPGDRVRAFSSLHTLSDNQEVPPLYRALAMAQIATHFSELNDFQEMSEIVGKVEPYKTYIKDAGNDLRIAARKIFERANEIYPNALAQLGISMINASRLMNGLHESGISDAEMARRIQFTVREYSKKIDETTDDPLRGKLYIYSTLQRSLMYMMAGVSLGVSDRILRNVPYEEIEELMITAVSFEGRYPEQRLVVLQADTARLYHAASVWSRFGKEREDDVNATLQPVYLRSLDAEGDKVHIEFLRNLGDQQGTFLTTQLREIAKRIPKFKTYLNSYGWEI